MLKNIFVPTDFSENADHALQYALNLAKSFQLNIYVFNAHMTQTQGGMMLSIDDVIKHEREAELEELMVKIRPQLDDDVISGHVAIVHNSVDAICSGALSTKSDLIIMGTKGATGLKKLFMGSTASNVIRKTSLPVLTVPENAPVTPPKRVTLAIDTEDIEYSFFLLPVMNLLLTIKPEFTITHVQDEHEIDKTKGIFKFFNSHSIPYTYKQLKGDTVEDAITNHIEENETDLLCLINHKRTFFQRLMHPSMTQKLVMGNKIPLLVLHDYQ
ncbi:MAG: universal stress protein [Aureispira sp.]|nr:universal stress protein [Aureispira sp.]